MNKAGTLSISAEASGAQRRAFFAALRATGNQTLAAERAGVSRSWMSLHRAQDPASRAEMEAAIATACERLRGAADDRPPAKWRTGAAGEELVVRGTERRAQIARAGPGRWTARAEARFLDALEATCNVRAACAAAGLSVASAYQRLQRSPGFAERWFETLEAGRAKLDLAALDEANGAPVGDIGCFGDIPRMSVDEAVQLLRLHRREVKGVGRAPGAPRKPRDLEALRPGILRKLETVNRVLQREAESRGGADTAVSRGTRDRGGRAS